MNLNLDTVKNGFKHSHPIIILIKEKKLYERFKRLINTISHDKTWTWLRKGNFKGETESLQIAAKDSAIRTNHIKARIYKTQ